MPTGTIEAFERKTGENTSVKDLLHYCGVSEDVWQGRQRKHRAGENCGMWLNCCLFHITYCEAFKNEEKNIYLDAQAGQCRSKLVDATFALQTVKLAKELNVLPLSKVKGQNKKTKKKLACATNCTIKERNTQQEARERCEWRFLGDTKKSNVGLYPFYFDTQTELSLLDIRMFLFALLV